MNHPLLRACCKSHDCIVVRRGVDCWMTDTWGSEYDRIVELFGTNALPTPFGNVVDAQDVVAEISRLNPGVEIVLA